LADDQGNLVAMPIAPGNNDRFAATGMKSVTNNRLTRLIMGIIPLLQPYPAPSSADGK
jgi:hypothetical protein